MESVLNSIVASKRLPVLFIGAGISKRYLKDYPSWNQLLDDLRDQIGIPKTAFAAKQHEIKSAERSISEGKLNQKLATYLQEKLLSKIEREEIDLAALFTEDEITECVENGSDYFKKLISKRFESYTLLEDKTEEFEKLKEIGQKISMVFTTNYDRFLQNEVFSDFKVYEKQDKYYFRTSNGYGELFKIHGCISSPNGIIITENDYKSFDLSLKLISSKLLNALMDYPIIFLGYSLEDENIKRIISDFVSCFDEHILNEIKKYMIMVVYEKDQHNLVEGEKQFTDSESGKSITMTTIKTDNFGLVYDYINKLTPTATAYELRRYKIMVADLISKAARGEKRVFVQELDEAKSDALALYIGSKNSIESFSKSTLIFENSEIISKALHGEQFDYDSFAKEWYDSKCIKSTEYTPVFYIHQRMSIKFDDCGSKFKKNFYEKEKCFSELCLKLCADAPRMSKDAIQQKYAEVKNKNCSASSICSSLCPDIENVMGSMKISVNDGIELLKTILNEFPDAVKQSPFKRCACFAWYLEYKKSTEG